MKRWVSPGVSRTAWTVLAVVLCLAASPLAAQRPLAPDPVRDAVRVDLVRALETSKRIAKVTVVDPATLKAIGQDGIELTISLDNLVADIRTRPAARTASIERFVRLIESNVEKSSAKPEPTRAAVMASLRPVVRSQAYLDSALAVAKDEPAKALLHWPLAGNAVILVAIDGAEQVQMINGEIADKSGLSRDDVLKTAIANLEPLVAGVRFDVRQQFTLILMEEDYYTSGLLLMPNIVTRLEKSLGADFVVLLPDRNNAVAARARDANALLALGTRMARERKQPPLIPHLLQRTPAGWRVPS